MKNNHTDTWLFKVTCKVWEVYFNWFPFSKQSVNVVSEGEKRDGGSWCLSLYLCVHVVGLIPMLTNIMHLQHPPWHSQNLWEDFFYSRLNTPALQLPSESHKIIALRGCQCCGGCVVLPVLCLHWPFVLPAFPSTQPKQLFAPLGKFVLLSPSESTDDLKGTYRTSESQSIPEWGFNLSN